MTREDTITELILQARTGREDAVLRLVNEYKNLFQSIARKYQGLHVEYKDLNQQIYREFLLLLKEYDPARNVFFGYYLKKFLKYRVGRALNMLTRLPCTRYSEDVNVTDTFSGGIICTPGHFYDDQKDKLSRLLKYLPEEEKRILVSKFWQDKTDVEIAHQLGKSQQCVNRLKKKVLTRLKESLAGQSPDGIFKIIKLSKLKLDHASFEEPAHEFMYEKDELFISIKEIGILHPVVVQINPENNLYEVICGRRRAISAKSLNPDGEIPAVVYERLDFGRQISLYLAENLCRRDLKPVELGLICSYFKNEVRISHDKLSGVLKVNPKEIQRYLRLLKLSQPVMQALRQEKIKFWDALLLGKVDDAVQLELLEEIIKNNLTIRQIKERIKDFSGRNNSTPGIRLPGGVKIRKISPSLLELQVYYSEKSQLTAILRQLLKVIKDGIKIY